MRKMGSLVITSLFIVTIALVLLGVVMVMSSSQYVSSSLADGNVYEYMGKQLIWFSIGLAGLGFFSMYDYNLWQPKARFLMLLALFLLVLILIPPFGFKSHGATRWLNTPFVKVQPSDFAKLTIVLYLAAVWAERKEELGSFVKGILYPMIVVGLALFLIIIEPDHGTVFFIGILIFVLWFAAGGRILHLVQALPIFLVALLFALWLKPHLFDRIWAWIYPEDYPTLAYQLKQSISTIAHGGVAGVGVGNGLGQLGFTPEPHTDFIFSIMGEELGFFRCSIVLGMYLSLILLGYLVALRCVNPFGTLLAIGCTTAIGFQTALNLAVVTGLTPTTGISLPFISYGGSSLVACMSMVGLLINIAKESFALDERHPVRRSLKKQRHAYSVGLY